MFLFLQKVVNYWYQRILETSGNPIANYTLFSAFASRQYLKSSQNLLFKILAKSTLSNPRKICTLISSWNLHFIFLRKSALRGVPAQGEILHHSLLWSCRAQRVSLFVGLQDHWFWSVFFHCDHNSCQVILVPPRVGYNSGNRSFRYS